MSSSSSKSKLNVGSPSKSNTIKRCGCRDVCPVWVSRTGNNPGKRFWGCPNYEDPGVYCGYFKWIDPPSECVEGDNKITQKKPIEGIEPLQRLVAKENPNVWNESVHNRVVTLLQLIVGLLVTIVILLILVVYKMS